MTEYVIGIGSALWLGVLTSIRPCPLAMSRNVTMSSWSPVPPYQHKASDLRRVDNYGGRADQLRGVLRARSA